MIRRPTWIALILLAALIAFTVYLRQKKEAAPAVESTPTPAEQSLFSSAAGQPTDISISSAEGETVEISRGADGSWVLKQPAQVPADQGQAEAAATQTAALQNL